jgi:hypothetical protein
VLLQPEVSYPVWQTLRVALTGDVIGAEKGTYFHSIRNEDRIGLRLEYSF